MSKKNEYLDEKTIHEILKPYAYKIFKDLSYMSHKVINDFYADYSPDYYIRTFGMKNLFNPNMRKIKNGWSVEFVYSFDNLTTEHNSNIAVFDGSFVHGYHGGKYAWGHIANTPQMTPSPWEILEDYANAYKL